MQLDDDDIKSYQQRAYFDSKPKQEVNPINIFFAVLAAILVSWFIREAYIEYQARQALALLNQQLSIINEQAQRQFENIQLQTEAMNLRAQKNARLRAEALIEQKQIAQQTDLKNREETSNKINEQIRKEQAWAAAYKPVKGCETDNPDKDAIKCGNDYARAHRKFEASWINNQ